MSDFVRIVQVGPRDLHAFARTGRWLVQLLDRDTGSKGGKVLTADR